MIENKDNTLFLNRQSTVWKGDNMEEILHKSIREVGDLLKKREISSHELTLFYLDRIERFDSTVQSYLRITEKIAMSMADEADVRLSEGKGEPLTGIPFGMKDILCSKGVETTCGSQILKASFRPTMRL
jgi:aspartyl-tRNA(Asn)/glutamyl-tRNA(Gln) amidotransferase subunit A